MQESRIIKYLKGLATETEQKEIYDWFSKSTANQDYFYEIKVKYIASKFDETSINVDDLYSEFKSFSSVKPLKKYRVLKYMVAAVLVMSAGFLGYFRYSENNNSNDLIPEGVITLEMPNGEVKIIDEEGKAIIADNEGNTIGKQQGRELTYNDLDSTRHKAVVEYNTLTVPYAKQFTLVLSDNTSVVLNSGTSLKYPIKFIDGVERKVFLEGEAFFDVKTDTLHPFIVNTKQLNVRVLGTRFNVSSYAEDSFVNTVLEEGSVNIYDTNKEYDSKKGALLKPGQIAVFDKTNKSVNVSKADMDIHLAWKDGKIVLKHTPFKNAIKKLERNYDVRITNNNIAFDEETFTASFDVETVEQVFEAFSEGFGLEYIIKGSEIIINP